MRRLLGVALLLMGIALWTTALTIWVTLPMLTAMQAFQNLSPLLTPGGVFLLAGAYILESKTK